MSKFGLIKQHFENATDIQLRGNSSEIGIRNYALFILSKIKITKGRILDIGCGDGKIMAEMQHICPGLNIDGVELSTNLSKKARELNPNSNIFNCNALEFENINKYDIIFSFSFAQYLDSIELLQLNKKLILFLNENGKVMHLSIPDFQMKNAVSFVEYSKKYEAYKFVFRYLLNLFKFNKSYGNDSSKYHDSKKLKHLYLKNNFLIEISSDSDSYYRFDFILSKTS